MKKSKNMEQLAQCVVKCMLCCISCLESFIKFFNKHAYVEIALRSTNFCTSAANGMKVVATNFLRFGILHGLGEIVMNFVVIFMTLIGVYLSYVIITLYSPQKSEFNGTAASLVVIGIIILTVGKLFAHIWEVSSDSILHCHCIDETLEGGNARHSTQKLENVLNEPETGGKNGGTAGYY